ncbi:hypothetical protein PU629_06655 [Pullulanibacillus sp. KACC 23026]|uniref:hypothetical protein n=1 Tax=Pullulanibacillus sp. KACC 23026 TaxID=3028315 RepID=UPI0023B17D5C|nr:hypothetical protein [Pullulanibacillus sp. KACC 23026]WEG14044.1 hypothetical protein PU629_06655 [Pullulanibacillus sp. KACC 23026]
MFNRWRYNKYRLPPWIRAIRDGIELFILPLAVFQGLRMLFFPTTFDIILFIVMIALYICFLRSWI